MIDGKHYRNYECTENISHISEKEWVKNMIKILFILTLRIL